LVVDLTAQIKADSLVKIYVCQRDHNVIGGGVLMEKERLKGALGTLQRSPLFVSRDFDITLIER
jgi:hypothetical protein